MKTANSSFYYAQPPYFLRTLGYLFYLPIWWYLHVSQWFFSFLTRILRFLEGRLALRLTLRLLFKPLYQDYTIIGVVIGPIIRFLKVIVSIFVIFSWAIVVAAAYFAWMLLPFFVIISWFAGDQVLAASISFPFVLGLFIYYREFIATSKTRLMQTSPKNLFFASSPTLARYFRDGLTIEDLFKLLWKDVHGRRLLLRLGLSVDAVVDQNFCSTILQREKLVIDSRQFALKEKVGHLHCGHILLATVSQSSSLLDYLQTHGVTIPVIQEVIHWVEQEKEFLHPTTIFHSEYTVYPNGGVNRSWSARPTPVLDQYSRDLTAHVSTRLPIIAKESVIEDVSNVLSRRSAANPLVIGSPGSGKSTVLVGLAQSIIDGTAAPALRDKRVVLLDPGLLLAGDESRERITTIISEILAAGNVLLAIDELHTMISSGENSALSPVFSALEPHLEDPRLRIIGTTSPAEYRHFIEPHAAFARHFHRVELDEATATETLEIMKYASFELEREFNIVASYPALQKAVILADRLVHDRVFPDKAIDLLESTVVAVGEKGKGLHVLSAQDVAAAAAEQTHVPVGQINAEESATLLSLESALKEKIIGQGRAVKAVADILRRARVGVTSPERPLGSLLLVGPTGVGKTEVAKVLSEHYFGSQDSMIRLDMSEYQEVNAVHQLIGAPVGDGDTVGYLTEAVRRRPYSLILFDELEKAHPRVLDLFLQVLEDGRVTTGTGVRVNFSNALIMATSNVGSNLILSALKDSISLDTIQPSIDEALVSSFRPEFLNRFDGVVVMNALSERDVEHIAVLMLQELAERLLETHDITVQYDPAMVHSLASRAYTPEFGARPLRRLIQNTIEARLARMILAEEVKRGGSVMVDEGFLD